jgi:site-specific DNA-methyltransferase (adenine-specific)
MFSIFNADCLTKLKDISSNSVDLVICDLPFGCLTSQTYKGVIDKSGSDLGKTYGEKITWDIKIDLEAFWKEIKRIRKDEHTPTLHFTTTKYGFDLYNSNPKEFRYDLVWDKGRGVSFLSANKMPLRSHEMVYVFSKAGANYNRVDISGNFKPFVSGKGTSIQYGGVEKIQKKNDGSTRCIMSVIQNKTSSAKGGHPTEKPIELYKFLIERYSKEGDTVLDPTFGSGNSGLACRELKRNYIGIEKNKEFFDKFQKKL